MQADATQQDDNNNVKIEPTPMVAQASTQHTMSSATPDVRRQEKLQKDNELPPSSESKPSDDEKPLKEQPERDNIPSDSVKGDNKLDDQKSNHVQLPAPGHEQTNGKQVNILKDQVNTSPSPAEKKQEQHSVNQQKESEQNHQQIPDKPHIKPSVPQENHQTVPTPVKNQLKVSTPAQNLQTDPTPVKNQPADPTPAQTQPTVPTPPQNQPAVPTPAQNQPTVPTPAQNQPTVPTHVKDQPTVPTPVQNQPTVPTPVNNQPTVPTPIDKKPTVPTPVNNQPTVPTPAQTQPTVPVPSDSQPVSHQSNRLPSHEQKKPTPHHFQPVDNSAQPVDGPVVSKRETVTDDQPKPTIPQTHEPAQRDSQSHLAVGDGTNKHSDGGGVTGSGRVVDDKTSVNVSGQVKEPHTSTPANDLVKEMYVSPGFVSRKPLNLTPNEGDTHHDHVKITDGKSGSDTTDDSDTESKKVDEASTPQSTTEQTSEASTEHAQQEVTSPNPVDDNQQEVASPSVSSVPVTTPSPQAEVPSTPTELPPSGSDAYTTGEHVGRKITDGNLEDGESDKADMSSGREMGVVDSVLQAIVDQVRSWPLEPVTWSLYNLCLNLRDFEFIK